MRAKSPFPRSSGWLICCICLSLLAATSAEARVVALRPNGTKAVLTGDKHEAGRPLPRRLVVSPGRYVYGERSYQLSAGAYRIGKRYRVVFNGAVRPLMSGIAWLTNHGFADNVYSPEQLDKSAMHRRLNLSCGGVSRFAVYELGQLGIDARRVALVTPYEITPYTGHTVMEVYRRGWQVYDLDYNMRPLVDGRPVRGIDYVKASDRDLSFDWLSGDATRFKRLPDNYRYQMGTALIEDGPNFFYTDPVGHTPEELTSFSNGWYRYLPRAEFMARLYP
jgi:hypothetical protein